MTVLVPDYHMHTERCGHAAGSALEYVEEARRLGLPGVGIADHLPLLHGRDPQLSMDLSELDSYVEEVLELKARYPGYVLLAVEADYRPDTVHRLADLLASQPFDYVIGSVHYLDGWGFDDPRYKDGFGKRDVDEVYRQYLELVGDAAESGLFTILGHLDLVKKFGHRPRRPLDDEVAQLADRIGRAGVAVELNTAGLRKAVEEIYPSLAVLRALRACDVPITFGSDAHRPREVGKDFDRALALAREAGYAEHLVLRGRSGGESEAGRAALERRPLPEVT